MDVCEKHRNLGHETFLKTRPALLIIMKTTKKKLYRSYIFGPKYFTMNFVNHVVKVITCPTHTEINERRDKHLA